MKNVYIIFIAVLSCGAISCQKEFLEKKSDKALLIPSTLDDFQALLDYEQVMSRAPSLNEISTDDFYTSDNGWLALNSTTQRSSYLWADDLYGGSTVSDWNIPYQQIFYSNVVLDGLKELKPEANQQMEWNRIKGSALFHRALAFYNLAQLFAGAFDQATAAKTPGIPIRLTADVNETSARGSLQNTYDQIIADLLASEKLLPVQTAYKSRPGKPAVQALLSRVYQTMELYDNAEAYASLCLQSSSKLIDFNTLNASTAKPMPPALPNGNDEVIFYNSLLAYSYLSSTLTIVDSALYRSYVPDDLRRTVFFIDRGKEVINFKGTYSGRAALFSGLATDEVYLIRAECYARKGNIPLAMKDLNTLIEKRWKKGKFTPLVAGNPEEALKMVLIERRKELISRGLRWTDLKRLNKDPLRAVTLKRVINGATFELVPNHKRYVFSIPQNEITGSGIEQNPR